MGKYITKDYPEFQLNHSPEYLKETSNKKMQHYRRLNIWSENLKKKSRETK